MRKHYSDSYIEKINWSEVQKFYDEGNFWKDIMLKFNFTSTLICYAVKLNLLKMRSRSESNRLYKSKNTYKHTQETKDKISRIRKEYLKNNPDKVPYLINHSRKESYPEKYFTEIFKKENLNVVKAYRVGLYELDFAIPDRRIDIEIDGSQHYYDKRIVESDIRRNKFLEDNGWDIIRIEWSKYQKMRKIEKLDYIQNLKSYIDNLLVTKPLIMVEDIKRQKNKSTCVCGAEKEIKSRTCNKCRGLKDRKVERPSYEELIKEVSELGYCGTGRKYGVSDNAIRKWIKRYESE